LTFEGVITTRRVKERRSLSYITNSPPFKGERGLRERGRYRISIGVNIVEL